jgi:hypothetical protein
MTRGAQMSNRIAISKRVRFEVFKRDGFECQYCGATPPGAVLHCDHIDPVANGGTNDMDNLVTACQSCNQGKSAVLLSMVPQSLELRMAEIREREEQIAGYQGVLRLRRERIEEESQEILNRFCDHHSVDGIPKRDFLTIKRFIDGIGLDDVISALELGLSKFPHNRKRSFAYFCGICWKKMPRSSFREETN